MDRKDFFENYEPETQAEFTNRIIQGDEEFDHPEMMESGKLNGQKVNVYYRPTDPKNSEEWMEYVDWEAALDRVCFVDEYDDEEEIIIE